MLCQTERLAHLAPQPVSSDRVAGGFHRHCETQPWMSETIGFDAQRKEPIVDAPAPRVDRIELKLAAKSQLGAKT